MKLGVAKPPYVCFSVSHTLIPLPSLPKCSYLFGSFIFLFPVFAFCLPYNDILACTWREEKGGGFFFCFIDLAPLLFLSFFNTDSKLKGGEEGHFSILSVLYDEKATSLSLTWLSTSSITSIDGGAILAMSIVYMYKYTDTPYAMPLV